MSNAFLDMYEGQSTEDLLALESKFRIDSLVLAFAALHLDSLTAETVAAAALGDNESVQQAFAACDDRYFVNDEPIADRLFRPMSGAEAK